MENKEPKIEPMLRRIYHESFIEKNKDKVNQKCICEICGGSYTYFNKSRHNKTQKHQFQILQLKLRDRYQEIDNSDDEFLI